MIDKEDKKNEKSEFEIMMEVYKKLREKAPNHELFKLAKLAEDSKASYFTADYINKYTHCNDKFLHQGYVRYTADLEKALEKVIEEIK